MNDIKQQNCENADGESRQVEQIVIPPNHYKCKKCGGVFEYEWTDEEAIAEKEQNFPDIPLDECVIVCDDCYKELMAV